MLADPIAAGQMQEQCPVETPWLAEVDVLSRGGLPQPGGPRACLEPLLPAERDLLVDQQTEPFGVFEGAAFGIGREIAEPIAMPSRPSSRRRSSVGWFSKVVLLSGSSRSRGCFRAAEAHRPRLAVAPIGRAGV